MTDSCLHSSSTGLLALLRKEHTLAPIRTTSCADGAWSCRAQACMARMYACHWPGPMIQQRWGAEPRRIVWGKKQGWGLWGAGGSCPAERWPLGLKGPAGHSVGLDPGSEGAWAHKRPLASTVTVLEHSGEGCASDYHDWSCLSSLSWEPICQDCSWAICSLPISVWNRLPNWSIINLKQPLHSWAVCCLVALVWSPSV